MALLAWVFFRLVFSAFITCGRSCAEGNYTIGVDTHLISEEIEAVHLRGDGGLSRAFCPAAEDSSLPLAGTATNATSPWLLMAGKSLKELKPWVVSATLRNSRLCLRTTGAGDCEKAETGTIRARASVERTTFCR